MRKRIDWILGAILGICLVIVVIVIYELLLPALKYILNV